MLQENRMRNSSPTHSLELCIFDMDGLLINTERTALFAHQEAAKSFGVDLTIDQYRACIGCNYEAETKILQGFFPCLDVEEFLEQSYVIKDNFEKEHGIEVKEGVYEIFDYFEARKIPMMVATSTYYERGEELLKQAKLYHRIQDVVYGDMVAHSKPAPDIFLKALELAGNIHPKRAIVFEDSHMGIESANNAGIPVIMIPDLLEYKEELNCLAVFPKISDAIPLLETL